MPDLLREAQAAIDCGNHEAAIALLEPVCDDPKVSPHILLHLARAKAASGNEIEAEALFSQARERHGFELVADIFHGDALIRLGRLAEAETLLSRALQSDRTNILAANLLALCLFQQGRHVEAFAYWKKYGWSFLQSYLIDITIAFEQFMLQSPTPQHDAQEPLTELSESAEPHPVSFFGRHLQLKPLLNKAEKLLTNQETMEAYRLTVQALQMAPGDPDALLLKAVALYEMEHYEEAGRLLLDLARDEAFPLPRYFLAYSLLRLGQIEVAEAMMAKLAPQGPFDYYLHYHLGLARLLRGDLIGARQAFSIAYSDYFVDSREYCFGHLVKKVKAATERINSPGEAA